MKFLDLFRKKANEEPVNAPEEDDGEELEIYSGMRVEVTTEEGRLIFVAKLLGLRGNQAELHQYSEAGIALPEEPIHVRIRGYSDRDRKAVYMEGNISPKPNSIWQVEGLTLVQVGNDRAFFRLDTNLDASVTMFSGLQSGEKPCRLLNISVGGAFISSQFQYHRDDKFMLKVKLLEDRPESVMFCQVLRVIEKEGANTEYGCQFLELTEADQKDYHGISSAPAPKAGRTPLPTEDNGYLHAEAAGYPCRLNSWKKACPEGPAGRTPETRAGRCPGRPVPLTFPILYVK